MKGGRSFSLEIMERWSGRERVAVIMKCPGTVLAVTLAPVIGVFSSGGVQCVCEVLKSS